MINITFSKYVKMNGRLWEVNFRKLSRGAHLFYADTATLQGERISFEMQLESDRWVMKGQQIPEWIRQFDTQLGRAIDEGMQEYYPHIAGQGIVA